MADRSYKLTLSLSDGSTINAGTITAPQGPNGANGVTFTPSVSAAGVLSWTNNGGLTNPSPISIKGPKGDDAVITASDVENWGFTKNKGTVTSVAVKINGTIKGTVTSSGTIDLGTVLTEHQDISGKANLDGGNTFTGKQTLNSPGSDGYSINAAGYVKGSWLQASSIANKGANTGKVCVFDNSGWIYYRTPAEILAEAGGAKVGDIPTNYVNTDTAQDIDGIKSFYKTSIFKNGMQLGDGNKLYGASDVSNIENYMPQKDGTLAVLGDIPEIVQMTGTSTNSVMSQKSITDELAKKAKIVGGNTFENTQYFSGYSADVNYDYSIIDCFFGDGDNSATIFGVKHNADANDSGRVLIGADDGTNNSVEIQLNGNPGTSGQVLTSQGAGKTPVWSSANTSINGLSGGTLSSALVLDPRNSGGYNGHIEDKNGNYIFGFLSAYATDTSAASNKLGVGHTSRELLFRGSRTRPTYNGTDLMLSTDGKISASGIMPMNLNSGIYILTPTKSSQSSFLLYYKSDAYISISVSNLPTILYVRKTPTNDTYWHVINPTENPGGSRLLNIEYYGFYNSTGAFYYKTTKKYRESDYCSNQESIFIESGKSCHSKIFGSMDVDMDPLSFQIRVGTSIKKTFTQSQYSHGNCISFDIDITDEDGKIVFTDSNGKQDVCIFNRLGKDVSITECGTPRDGDQSYTFIFREMSEETIYVS